ncbi:hypothetical protein KGM_210339 [Danaus plexippus plexippus]|uniref:Uncharacterized protein n=1 Tax=Danaus plexippus plexippus TaxID=278856 RepID=A0A212EIZ4_DANPL|nr:hypothetical protein KGM_210339 [Danaus plexippus plexippus]
MNIVGCSPSPLAARRSPLAARACLSAAPSVVVFLSNP